MLVKLDVMAKPRSLAAGGMSSTSESGRSAWALASWPCRLQVMTRWRTDDSSSSARPVVAVLSGLSPERASETSSVGTSSPRTSRGLATMSVVAAASTRRRSRPVSAGASTWPANADVPAPVRMIRARGSLSSGRRKPSVVARSCSACAATSFHSPGCWRISAAVAGLASRPSVVPTVMPCPLAVPRNDS